MEKSPTQLIWRDNVPFSTRFDDPYYSVDGGLAESRFVFIDGAAIPRLIAEKDHIVIGETGFGTGLNFLATWQAWQAQGKPNRLTFISSEAYPLTINDLEQAHNSFPVLSNYAAQLRLHWPPPAAGYHFLSFEGGAITLILMFGDAAETFSHLSAQIDAWFLDGFAPAKNPEMWSDKLFDALSRRSHIGTTLATFTAAGFVRRALTEHGFSIEKTAGFGRKRERLIGTFVREGTNRTIDPVVPLWATTQPARTEHVVVIGAGIGGAMTADALRKRGVKVTVFKSNTTFNTSENLPIAVLVPKLPLHKTAEHAFYNAAFIYAAHHPVYRAAFTTDGTAIIAANTQEQARLIKVAQRYPWPTSWLDVLGDRAVMPKIGTLVPRQVLEAVLSGIQTTAFQVHKIQRIDDVWHLVSPEGAVIQKASTIVLAAGADTNSILERSGLTATIGATQPELRPTAGQVEIIPAMHTADIEPQTLSYGGYLSAATLIDDVPSRVAGASFTRLSATPQHPLMPNKKDRLRILNDLNQNIGSALQSKDVLRSWAGLRAVTADHLPLAGPLPEWGDLQTICQPLKYDSKKDLKRPVKVHEGLYVLTGLGSKGFQYAPLLGEYLAAMITGEPIPLPSNLIARLHPARSAVRAIIRSGTEASKT